MSVPSEEVIFDRSCQNSDHSDVWDDSALISAYDKAVSNAYTKIANRRLQGGSNEAVNSDVSTTASELNVKHDSAGKGQKTKSPKDATDQAKKWRVGDPCRAKYKWDGLMYEAKVTYVNHKNGSCRVTFVGYGNTESALLSSLEPTQGERSVKDQIRAAEAVAANEEAATVSGSYMYNVNPRDEQNEAEIESDASSQAGSKQLKQRRHKQYAKEARRFKHSSEQFVPDNCPLRTTGWGMPPRSSPWNEYLSSMPLPTPPPFPIDEPSGEDEALANMLMSWYMNGYHSGYYQGLKHSRMRRSSSSYVQRHC